MFGRGICAGACFASPPCKCKKVGNNFFFQINAILKFDLHVMNIQKKINNNKTTQTDTNFDIKLYFHKNKQ